MFLIKQQRKNITKEELSLHEYQSTPTENEFDFIYWQF